jgi:nitroreductase
MVSRRSVRDFSSKPVPREAIEEIVRVAGSAPSGANKRPWTFVAVQDEDLQERFREETERREREFYEEKASEDPEGCTVPDIDKKPLDEILEVH